jgi:CheY-like chemotaxis protein
MLSFARGARRAEQVRVGALLDALGLLLQGSVPRNVTLEMDAYDPELTFAGNHTELQQCLLNLSLNALQAMPEGGCLRIRTSQSSLPQSFFVAGEEAREGNYLCLTVADTGMGMSADVLRHMFEPFFTTKESGTGLGLISCKRIITAHGGVMRVESESGSGTSFHLYLPLLEQAVLICEEEESIDLQGEAERVLVVVEEAGQLSLLVDTLDSWGYQAHASQSGTAALQWLEAQGVPDLVVLDADMNLFTGVRTLAALFDHGYRSAVILLARPDAPPDMDELPVMEHLYLVDKPISTLKLLRTVREALEAGAGGELSDRLV